MADLALVTATQLEIDGGHSMPETSVNGYAEAALVKGDVATFDSSTGAFQKADADADASPKACYLILRTVAAGEPVTGYRFMRVTGFDLSGLNFGALVYLSANAGKIADGAPSGANSCVLGEVVPVFGQGVIGGADKALQFNTL